MHIDDYRFGLITVNGNKYRSDVIISPEGVDSSWWREQAHLVSVCDLAPVLRVSPDVVVIGTGAGAIMKVGPDAVRELEKRCSDFFILPTDDAVKKYNSLTGSDKRRIVAAMHLTC